MTGLGIFHLAPYGTTWVIVLYYICTFGLLIGLVFNASYPVKLNKYDRMENVALMAYFGAKMGYHVANLNKEWLEYLYSLRSEIWAGVFTFMVLGMMFSFQIINVIRYVKEG